MDTNDIYILVGSIAGAITILVILYFMLLWFLPRRSDKAYLAAARAKSRQDMQARNRATATVSTLQEPQFRPIADENAYVVGPTATAAEAQRLPRLPGSRSRVTVPPNMFLSSDSGQVLRFYTASELRNFPFDEHIAELRREIEAEEARRPHGAAARRTHHWLLSPDRAYPPSYPESSSNSEIVIRTPAQNIVINTISENETNQTNEEQRRRPLSARQENRRVCVSIPQNYGGGGQPPPEYLMPPAYTHIAYGTNGDPNSNNNSNNNINDDADLAHEQVPPTTTTITLS